MQKLNNTTFLYSPSDLTAFLGCRHSTYIEYKTKMSKDNPDISVKEIPSSSSDELVQQKGYEHEDEYLQSLKDSGLDVVEVSKEGDLKERADKTIEALKSGADIVFQAVFYSHPWRGDADFLRKVDTPSKLGDFSYEVVDTKLARTASGSHIIQCCAYSEMLKKIQGIPSHNIHIVLGDKTEVSFKTADYQYYYKYCKQSFEEYMEYLMSITDLNDLSLVDECQGGKYCKCEEQYAELHEEQRHLKLVANIRKSDIKKLKQNGIDNMTKLANLDLKEHSFKEINPDILKKLNHQAWLQEHKHTTGEDKVETIEYEPGKAFDMIPKPNPGDLFFDMEGYPLHPGGLEYLFGVHYRDDKGEPHFEEFWAHDSEAEKKTTAEFMEWICNHLKQHPNAYIYHYNHYETTALKRLTNRYSVFVEEMDNLLRAEKFVDLYYVVRDAIRTSEPGYSIKNLETFYMEKRDQEVTNAGDSIVEYDRWIQTGEQKILDDIRDYNKVDCESTEDLRNWLLELRPKTAVWFEPNTTEEEITTDIRKEWEVKFQQYAEKLEKSDAKINGFVTDMLGFHRREAKPQWWALFDRKKKDIYELMDDNECIANLKFTGETEPEKRSILYTYKFPPQEFKLSKGSSADIVTTGDKTFSAGTIFDIDSAKGVIKIKRGANQDPPPQYMSISSGSPMNQDQLIDAVYDYADDVINTGGEELAITKFVNKEIPQIKGIKSGQDIIQSDDALSDAKKAISGLENSYMFIQGPPGAGKTYSSSRIIADLLKQGKKVGISSNSHKAIHNLLEGVEEQVIEQKLDIKGYKKSSGDKLNESNYNSKYEEDSVIKNISSTKDIPFDGNLYAGTVYAFANEHFKNKLDYLFIDEAGQVGTANLIAMSRSTKNIILVGDQMQLGQPIQGIHPNESGTSTLEYLLGEQATISPDRGIFLAETYRMNSDITKFISDAFYDGRLKSNPQADTRKLILKDSELPNSGIALIHTNHQGCTQKSEEEAEIISEQYNKLLGSSFIDENGEETIISEDDILVISPYNVQVNCLTEVLPKGAKVGTVDKFQGQEAPIVIFSMTTSTPEDLPRDIEFLFSKNRLNVAVSRAQCLSIVVMNPQLQEATCKSPKQMELLNAFCMLNDYAHKVLVK